jgi:uncharacterized metal-binding protein
MILLTSSRLNLHLFLVAPILILATFFSLLFLEQRGVELILSTLYSFPCQIMFIITTYGLHYYLKTYSTHRWQNLEPAMLVRS